MDWHEFRLQRIQQFNKLYPMINPMQQMYTPNRKMRNLQKQKQPQAKRHVPKAKWTSVLEPSGITTTQTTNIHFRYELRYDLLYWHCHIVCCIASIARAHTHTHTAYCILHIHCNKLRCRNPFVGKNMAKICWLQISTSTLICFGILWFGRVYPLETHSLTHTHGVIGEWRAKGSSSFCLVYAPCEQFWMAVVQLFIVLR